MPTPSFIKSICLTVLLALVLPTLCDAQPAPTPLSKEAREAAAREKRLKDQQAAKEAKLAAEKAALEAREKQLLDALTAKDAPPETIWLESLDLKRVTQGYGEPGAGESVGNNPLTIKRTVFPHGIGTHTHSRLTVDLKRNALRFLAMVGIDDETRGQGTGVFSVIVDKKTKFESGPMKAGDAPKLVSVDLKGSKEMVLDVVSATGDDSYGHVDWGGALLVLAPKAVDEPATWPETTSTIQFTPPKLPSVFKPGPEPALHGPRVTGASPHRPFSFLIPATGTAPLSYAAQGLPKGLTLDAKTGIISGQIETAGTYEARLTVSNAAGKATRGLTIVCGPGKIALTPPLGWNAWNVFGEEVSAEKVRDQVDAMISSGLAAHGFQYIIVDDTWQARRDKDGKIGPNRRFGSLRALSNYVHSKGLKLGLQSSPNPNTCSGYSGSAGFEERDAALYASWGVDYLKYDWCPSDASRGAAKLEDIKAAFAKMRAALDKANRDVVFSIVPYNFGGSVWEWGQSVGANLWMTNAGMLDTWDSVATNGFAQADRAQFAGPGHWNDPGPLMLGRFTPRNMRFSRLGAGEQTSQVALWCLTAAPLIISCDMSQLDPNSFFPLTTALLTNDEVLDVDQDPLGQPGTRIGEKSNKEVWARPLWDGTMAVGLFNKESWGSQEVRVNFADLKLSGPQPVRDLWEHQDLGEFTDSFAIKVPKRGVALLKIGRPKGATTPTTVAAALPNG